MSSGSDDIFLPDRRSTLSALEILIFLFILHLTLQPLVEPDFGWHLRAGLDFLDQGGQLPVHDPYSHTMSDWAWVEHAWLTDMILALIYRGLGTMGGLGVIVFFGFLTVAAFLIAAARAPVARSHRLAAIAASLWVALPFVGARTQLVSLVGIAIVLWLYHHICRGRQAFIWLYPLLFLIWANLHGGFTAGLFFLGLILGASIVVRTLLARWPAIELDEPILTWKHVGLLALSLGLATVLTLVNPYGWHLYGEIYESLTDTLMIDTLREWQPVSLNGWAGTAFVTYLMVVSAFVLGWYRKVEPIRWTLLLVSLGLSLGHWRNVMIFLVVAAPLVAEMLEACREGLTRLAPRIDKKWPTFAATVGLAIAILMWGPDHLDRIVESGTNPGAFFRGTEYPIEAVEWIDTHRDQLGVRMYNDYSYGGFLLWWMPGGKIFIDGRMPAWQTGDRRIFYDYLALNREPPALDILDKYRVDWGIIPRETVLAYALRRQGDWYEIYSDAKVVVMRRRM